MIISVIGDCDTRPVLYTMMKICQTLGDVLLITANTRLIRMTDTRDSGGHLQNCMIGIADEGIDDFFENFEYLDTDFNYVIIDNLMSADAEGVIYVRGLTESEDEKMQLEYIDEYTTIDLYKGKLCDSKTLFKCEEFEAYMNMCTINSKLTQEVAKAISGILQVPADKLTQIGNAEAINTYVTTLPSTQPKRGLRGKVGALLGI